MPHLQHPKHSRVLPGHHPAGEHPAKHASLLELLATAGVGPVSSTEVSCHRGQASWLLRKKFSMYSESAQADLQEKYGQPPPHVSYQTGKMS